MDAILGEVEAAGLTPILDIITPPTWGYETLPDGVNGGSPNVADLADFATALATHYNGLTDRRAGRARLSGLERAEPQHST